jgi:hypothetical protein
MTIVYSQNFSGTSVGSLPSGWTNITGAWSVTATNPVTGSTHALIGGSGDGNKVVCTDGGPLADMEVRYDVNYQAFFIGVYLRTDAELQNGYVVIPNNTGLSSWVVYKIVSGSATQIGTIPSSGTITGLQSANPGTMWSVRARIQGSTIYFKLWDFGATEPTSWDGTISDTTFTGAGYFGFYNNSNGAGDATINNVTLDNLASSTLSVSPTSVAASSTGNTLTLTGTGTSWTAGTPGSPIFTASGGTIAAQTVTSATSATLTYTAPPGAGTVTITDPSTGDTASLTISASGSTTIPVTSSGIYWSPANWDHLTPGTFGVSVDTMETTAPGAEFHTIVTGTVNLTINLDDATTSGLSSGQGPILRYSLNNAPWVDVQIAPTQTSVVVSTSLTAGDSYDFLCILKGLSNTNGDGNVWGSSGVRPTNALSITGLTIDSGGSVSQPTLPFTSSLAVFSDSIGAGEHANYDSDGTDDSTASFAYHLARALGYNLSNISYGGQGLTVAGGSSMPALTTTYGQYSAGRNRNWSGVGALALIQGGNDARGSVGGSTIQSAVATLLPEFRAAIGAGKPIIVFVEIQDQYATNIQAAVAAYVASSGDTACYFVNPTSRLPANIFTLIFGSGDRYTYDNVHPIFFGHAVIGPVYADAATAVVNATATTSGYSRARVVNA